jgi:transposase
MTSEVLFAMALGLSEPWKITEAGFSLSKASGNKELHIHISFTPGSRFPDKDGTLCKVHDAVPRKWQHLNFFEYPCWLYCDVPRIKTEAGKVVTVTVPWARSGSGFTLLFEAFSLMLIEKEMPVNNVAEIMRVYAQRIWGIFNHWVGKAVESDKPTKITKLGVDETSTRKGHNYVTIAVDLEESRVVYATEGKGKETMESIKQHLDKKGVPEDQVQEISMDLSPSFIAGAIDFFPAAQITFDRFHVTKLLHGAMDKVRKAERKEHDELKGQKYVFLKNPKNLTDKQQESLSNLIELYPILGKAYRLKELFKDLWEMPTRNAANSFLQQWCSEVEEAKIPAFMKFVKTLKAHWSGIIHFVESKLTNGILEGINSKIQLAKRRARGFRNLGNFIHMIYFLCGKLKFDYPLYFT